jgi:hypothetical protein
MQKLEQEDLIALQQAHKTHSDVRSDIADTSIMITRFQRQRDKLVNDVTVAESNLIEIEKGIKKKYGAIRISLMDGAYETESK